MIAMCFRVTSVRSMSLFLYPVIMWWMRNKFLLAGVLVWCFKESSVFSVCECFNHALNPMRHSGWNWLVIARFIALHRYVELFELCCNLMHWHLDEHLCTALLQVRAKTVLMKCLHHFDHLSSVRPSASR